PLLRGRRIRGNFQFTCIISFNICMCHDDEIMTKRKSVDRRLAFLVRNRELYVLEMKFRLLNVATDMHFNSCKWRSAISNGNYEIALDCISWKKPVTGVSLRETKEKYQYSDEY